MTLFSRKNLLIILLLLLPSACGGEPAADETAATAPPINATARALSTAIAASAEPPRDLTAIAQQIDAAEARWQEQGITRYSVEVRFRQPTWNTQIIQMTVADGVVVESEHSCFPQQDCIMQDVDPQTMTIAAMFDVAREIIALENDELAISFNENIGYPLGISYDDGSWVYGSFEQLEPAP